MYKTNVIQRWFHVPELPCSTEVRDKLAVLQTPSYLFFPTDLLKNHIRIEAS